MKILLEIRAGSAFSFAERSFTHNTPPSPPFESIFSSSSSLRIKVFRIFFDQWFLPEYT